MSKVNIYFVTIPDSGIIFANTIDFPRGEWYNRIICNLTGKARFFIMVKHIVCFKLKDPTPEECEKCREVLLSMKGNVPTLRGIEVGIDFMRSARSCDVVLLVDVEDRNALTEYDHDKYHCEVVKTHMHAVCASSTSADYEY